MLLDIIIQLTQKELRVRYKHLSLGYLWSIANPLAFAFLYYVVFKQVMKVKIENFPIFLICGMFPWQWFINSISVGSWTFLGNAPLIKKVNFPRNLLSLVIVFQDLIHFYISIPIIILFLFIFDITPSWTWFLGIPLLTIIQFMLTYGLNLFIATINLFFRDLERLIGILMTFLFYFTPVIYDLSMVPIEYRDLIVLNPVAPLIICWRDLFMNGVINWNFMAYAFGWASIALVVGHLVYKKLSWRFAEIL